MKKLFIYVLSCLLLIGCNVNYEEEASVLLEEVNGRATIPNEEADKYNLGIGYNSSTHTEVGETLDWSEGKTFARDDNSSNMNILRYKFVRTRKQARELMSSDLDIGVNVKYGDVGVNASVKSQMFNELSFSSNSLTMIVSCDIITKTVKVADMHFKKNILDFYHNRGAQVFRDYYGDRFLSEVEVGGVMYFMYNATTYSNSSTNSQTLEAALKVKYDTCFLNVDVNTALKNHNLSEEEYYSTSISTETYYNGEPWETVVKDFNDFNNLRNKFSNHLLGGNLYVRAKKYTKYPFMNQPPNIFYTTKNMWLDYKDYVLDSKILSDSRIRRGRANQEDRNMYASATTELTRIEEAIYNFDYLKQTFPSLDFGTKVAPYMDYVTNSFRDIPSPGRSSYRTYAAFNNAVYGKVVEYKTVDEGLLIRVQCITSLISWFTPRRNAVPKNASNSTDAWLLIPGGETLLIKAAMDSMNSTSKNPQNSNFVGFAATCYQTTQDNNQGYAVLSSNN